MKINHIGYAVANMHDSIQSFELLGFYVLKETINDLKRNIEITFMKSNDTVIELISPLNSNSPVSNILKKMGNTPYHLCFETLDIGEKINQLKSNGFIAINAVDEAVAIDNKKIVFLYNKSIGIIELVEI